MWRQDNWEVYTRNIDNAHNTEKEIYEAGADAMLTAIRARGYISGQSLRNIEGAPGWAGIAPDSKWYSIPEDN